MTRHLNRPAKSGFTLIELLVVIAIIALLIGILLPALGSARDSARDLKCAANARGMGTAMELYAADNKDWYPIMPTSAANGSTYSVVGSQHTLGVASMFSLFQVGQAEWAGGGTPPSANLRGYIGGPAQGIGAYPNGKESAIMSGYMDAYEVLYCPRDKADTHWQYPTSYWNAQYTINGDDFTELVPEAPQSPEDVVQYNISYLYFAGFRSSEPGLIAPPPLWGDETYTNDNVTNAFYGHGYDWVEEEYRNGWQNTGEAIGFNPTTGYARVDNHGADGGHFVFTDGHVEFLDKNPQRTFFARASEYVNSYDAEGRVTGRIRVPDKEREIAKQEGKSINLVNPNRSSFMQTIE
ncbi:MAG: type II secretion system protein [Phycisphaerales bacterium]